MASNKKRLDRFYHLAREQGYRSRAAYKLKALDQRYDFLARARGVLDLCAAPGSWMQVARQNMPADSPCIGVDLAPIKPVTKCIALQEDITSQRCRVAIRRHLLDAKVDVVLHDGAPNVGTSWLQDAYGQNELTIFALRLAVDFLQPGGCFVTKAFRSQDYNSLLYVFKQLFAHVEATKPQASRNESAEIFVVCRGFKNAQIDPRFLDPKTVFKDLDVPTPSANVLQQRKGKKAKAEGYEPGAQLLRIERPIVEFVLGAAPVKLLGEAHCFTWGGGPECALWLAHEATTVEVRECCKDLRVLGKGEFRKLLAWRLKMADAWSAAESARRVNEQAGESGVEGGGIRDGLDERECDSEASAAEENTSTLQRLQRQRLKGTKRRRAEQAAKFKERLALKMEHPGDRLDASEEQELFSLSRIRSAGALAVVSEDAQPDETAEEVVSPAQHAAGSLTTVNEGALDAVSTVDHLDEQLEAMYAEYKQRVGKRALARLAAEENKGGGGAISKSAKRKARVALETEDGADPEELARRLAAAEMAGSLRAVAYDGEAESDVIESDDEGTVGTGHGGDARLRRNPLLARLVPKPERDDVRRETRQEEERWFGEPLFAALGDENDFGVEDARSTTGLPRAGAEDASDVVDAASSAPSPQPKRGKKRAPVASAPDRAGEASFARQEEVGAGPLRDSDDGSDGETSDPHLQAAESKQAAIERRAEAMALGQLLLRPAQRRDLEDAAYNRHTFNDHGLPQWFLDDERKHSRPTGYGVELPSEALGRTRDAMKAINARSIKKVAEAKARKKRRTERALTKIRKKSLALSEKADLSEREKASEMSRLSRKKLTQKHVRKKIVVGRKFMGGSAGKRSRNVKLVDSRMRADSKR